MAKLTRSILHTQATPITTVDYSPEFDVKNSSTFMIQVDYTGTGLTVITEPLFEVVFALESSLASPNFVTVASQVTAQTGAKWITLFWDDTSGTGTATVYRLCAKEK